jgi:hypothetical protein
LQRNNKILIFFLILFGTNWIFGQSNDSLRINYNYINSSPQNASVYIDGEHEGNTPLFFTWKDSIFPKQIKVTMMGYSDYTDVITNGALINKTYSLVPLKGTVKYNPVKEDKSTYFNKPRKVIPIVLSSILTVVGGVSAYYNKNKALDERDRYLLTGNPEALDKHKEYDVLAAVSLVVFQAGLGFLVYYLLIDN